jgi:flavodoxin
MHAGIIVHSQSGHTVLLARAIADRLRQAGHETDIHMLRPQGTVKPHDQQVSIRNSPDVSQYDCILTGGPVWGFAASPVIMAFLKNQESLKGKTAAPFVTMGLPLRFMGANQALARMSGKLESLGATVLPGEALHWFLRAHKDRIEQTAAALVTRIIELFGAEETPADETPPAPSHPDTGSGPGTVRDPDSGSAPPSEQR